MMLTVKNHSIIFKLIDETDRVWEANIKTGNIEWDFEFEERVFSEYEKAEITVEWEYIRHFVTCFLENLELIMKKSMDMLVALNLQIGLWDEEKRNRGIYDLLNVRLEPGSHVNAWRKIMATGKTPEFSANYSLTFIYIDTQSEDYYLRPKTFWRVSFVKGTILAGAVIDPD